MKKTLKVIMLPTDGISNIYTSKEKTPKGIEYVLKYGDGYQNNGLNSSYQHLYLVSNEEIKEGDWWYNERIGVGNNWNIVEGFTSEFKKVEATTDKSLKKIIFVDLDTKEEVKQPLPQIPESFVKYFVKQNGKVDEVEVECESMYVKGNYQNICVFCGELFTNTDKLGFVCQNHNKLKLTDNNEVIVHLPKKKEVNDKEINDWINNYIDNLPNR